DQAPRSPLPLDRLDRRARLRPVGALHGAGAARHAAAGAAGGHARVVRLPAADRAAPALPGHPGADADLAPAARSGAAGRDVTGHRRERPAIDGGVLRAVMASYPTGVTIITSQFEGNLVGMAANSFTSVSLDPPIVLVCCQRHARTAAAAKR